MGGHEDGVFTFGRSLAEAGQLMVHELVRARVLIQLYVELLSAQIERKSSVF